MLPLALPALDATLGTRSRHLEMYACVCIYTYAYAQVLPSTSSTNSNMKCATLAHTALLLFGLSSLCQGHSWVEQVSLVSQDGTLLGPPGYPRGNGTFSQKTSQAAKS